MSSVLATNGTGNVQGQRLDLMQITKNGEQANLRQNKREKCTLNPKPFYIQPKSFLILLMVPDLGAIGKGSTGCVQHGAMATLGLDIGQPDMGDLRVFGWRAWLCDK